MRKERTARTILLLLVCIFLIGFVSSAITEIGQSSSVKNTGCTLSLALMNSSRIAISSACTDLNKVDIELYDWNGSSWIFFYEQRFSPITKYDTISAIDSSKLFVVSSIGGYRQLRVLNFTGSSLDFIGSGFNLSTSLSGYLDSLLTINSSRVLYINPSDNNLITFDWNGSSFSKISNITLSENFVSYSSHSFSKINSSRIVLSFDDYLQIYDWNGSSWNHFYNKSLADGQISMLNQTRLFYSASDSSDLRLFDWNGTSFNQVLTDDDFSNSGYLNTIASVNSSTIVHVEDGYPNYIRTYGVNVDVCSQNLINTSKSSWINISCSSNQMNQSRNWTQYDANVCGTYTNQTFFEYQLNGTCNARLDFLSLNKFTNVFESLINISGSGYSIYLQISDFIKSFWYKDALLIGNSAYLNKTNNSIENDQISLPRWMDVYRIGFFYFNVPKGASITEASFNLTAEQIEVVSKYCVQQQANATHVNDTAGCTFNFTGGSYSSSGYWNDGVWGNYETIEEDSYSNINFFINYTIPSNISTLSFNYTHSYYDINFNSSLSTLVFFPNGYMCPIGESEAPEYFVGEKFYSNYAFENSYRYSDQCSSNSIVMIPYSCLLKSNNKLELNYKNSTVMIDEMPNDVIEIFCKNNSGDWISFNYDDVYWDDETSKFIFSEEAITWAMKGYSNASNIKIRTGNVGEGIAYNMTANLTNVRTPNIESSLNNYLRDGKTYCYQEQTDVNKEGDTDCDNRYFGSYSSIGNFTDGNHSTFIYPIYTYPSENTVFNITYSKPANLSFAGANFNIHYNNGTDVYKSIAIQDICFNDSNYLVLNFDVANQEPFEGDSYIKTRCKYKNEWILIDEIEQDYVEGSGGGSGLKLYEENITWFTSEGSCTADENGNCQIPIVIYSDTAGKINLSSINLTYQVPMENITQELRDALALGNCNCSGCEIIGNNCSIPISFYSSEEGEINYTLTLNSDVYRPVVVTLTPDNQTYNNQTQNYSANITSQFNITNATLNIYNSTGGIINTTFFDSFADLTQTVVSILVNLADGIYTWFWSVFDINGNEGVSQNTTLTIATSVPEINIVSPTEENTANKSQTWIFFNTTIVDDNFKNVTYYLYNSTGLKNTTSYVAKIESINFTGLPQGTYIYFSKAYNTNNNFAFSENRTINLDTSSPNVTLLLPANNSYSNNRSQNLTANITDNFMIKNITMTMYNSLGSVFSHTTVPGTASYIDSNYITGISDNVWYWNYKSYDFAGNVYTSPNNTLTIDATNPVVSITSPENNTFSSNNWFAISTSVTEINFKNITYNLYNSTSLVNSTNYLTNINSINWTSLLSEIYTYNSTVCDLANNCGSSTSQTITLDTSLPSGTLINPANNTYSNNATHNFTASVSDNSGIKNASLWINGVLNQTITFVEGVTQSTLGIVITLVDGTYNWFYSIFDWSGNNYQTQNNTLAIDRISPLYIFNSPINNTYYQQREILINFSTASAPNSSTILDIDNSLVSWWRMDDTDSTGTKVIDYMGRNNGTAIGGATQVTSGKFGKAFSFDGSNDYISIGYYNLSQYTISMWINPVYPIPGGVPFYGLMNLMRGDTSESGFSLWGNRVSIYTTQLKTYSFSTNPGWHLITYTYNGTHMTGGVDGSIGSPVMINNTFDNPAILRQIGYRGDGASPYNGSIDDVMIFNRSLDSQEIMALYNSTSIFYNKTFESGNHTIKAYVQDLAGNINSTELREFYSPYQTNICNSTACVLQVEGNSTWEENANVTFTYQGEEDEESAFQWFVDGVQKLIGVGEKIFNFLFSLKKDVSSEVEMKKLDRSNISLNGFNDSTTSKFLPITANQTTRVYIKANNFYNATNFLLNFSSQKTNISTARFNDTIFDTCSPYAPDNMIGAYSDSTSNSYNLPISSDTYWDEYENNNISICMLACQESSQSITMAVNGVNVKTWTSGEIDVCGSSCYNFGKYCVSVDKSFFNIGNNPITLTTPYVAPERSNRYGFATQAQLIGVDSGLLSSNDGIWLPTTTYKALSNVSIKVGGQTVYSNASSSLEFHSSSTNVSLISANCTSFSNCTIPIEIFSSRSGYLNLSKVSLNYTSYSTEDFSRSFTINTNSQNPLISFGLNTPANDTLTNQSSIFVNISRTEINPKNITFSLYNISMSLVKNVSFTNDTLFYNFTNLSSNIYYYQVNTSDIVGNQNSTELRKMTINRPLELYFLSTSSLGNLYNTRQVFAHVFVYDDNFKNITYRIFDENNNVATTVYNSETNFHYFDGLTAGNYTFNVEACDVLDYCSITPNRSVKINSPGFEITTPQFDAVFVSQLTEYLMQIKHTINRSQVSACWYNVENLTSSLQSKVSNTSLANCENISITLAAPDDTESRWKYRINLFANDTLGLLGQTYSDFIITQENDVINNPGSNGGSGGTTIVVGDTNESKWSIKTKAFDFQMSQGAERTGTFEFENLGTIEQTIKLECSVTNSSLSSCSWLSFESSSFVLPVQSNFITEKTFSIKLPIDITEGEYFLNIRAVDAKNKDAIITLKIIVGAPGTQIVETVIKLGKDKELTIFGKVIKVPYFIIFALFSLISYFFFNYIVFRKMKILKEIRLFLSIAISVIISFIAIIFI